MTEDPFDEGGFLPTTWCAAVNETQAPEPVLTAEEWNELEGGEPC